MNVKRVYEDIGGNYSEALTRLMNDSLIEKFLIKFKDGNYINPIKDAISRSDYEALFACSHTLKGVALNMAFSSLGKSISELTDYVRGDNAKIADYTKINELFSIVLNDYNRVILSISNN